MQHGVEATFFSTEEVVLEHAGTVYWHGVVFVFDVEHANAAKAYAWTYLDGERERAVAVLGKPPIDTATKAAEAALAALYQAAQR